MRHEKALIYESWRYFLERLSFYLVVLVNRGGNFTVPWNRLFRLVDQLNSGNSSLMD